MSSVTVEETREPAIAELPPGTSTRRRLSGAIVCTDAIEQLQPLIPENQAQSNSNESVAQLRGASRLRRGPVQAIVTALPLMLSDILCLVACFYSVAFVVQYGTGFNPHSNFFLQGIGVGLVYLSIASLLGLFPATAVSPVYELKQLIMAALLSFATMLALNHLLAELSVYEILVAVICAAVVSLILPLTRSITRHHCRRYRWWGERLVIIGSGTQGQSLYHFYQGASQRGLRVLGVIDAGDQPHSTDSVSRDPTIPYLGSIIDLKSITDRYAVRWGMVAAGGCERMDMSQVMNCSSVLPNLVVLPSGFQLPSLWASPRDCAGVLGVHVKDHLQNTSARVFKRSFDIVGSLIGMLISAPFFLIAITWIKVKSPGPAFYGHTRIGRGERSFKAWKFRTMVQDADAVLEEHLERDPELRKEWFEDHKLKVDPRVIPGVGELLRKCSLDELPQLWNVFVGEMSLVGPRPIVAAEIAKYETVYSLYLRVRPGVTGLWQVSGRNNTSYEQRVRLDSYYICNWSGWLDYYILMRTIRTLLMKEGAY